MTSTDTQLYLDGVTVTFDGFRALNALSLTLNEGEMRAVIGPNGAGKTTMMDVITGKTRPDTGKVVFGKDTDLTRLDEPAIAIRVSPYGRGRRPRSASGSRRSWPPRGLAINATASRAACRTGRSNGLRSGC